MRASSPPASMACAISTEIAPDRYAAVFETKVAYMKFSFKVTVEVTRAEPPSEIEAKVEGTPLGIVGRLTATSLTTLSEVGDETHIAYEVDAALTGKLGSLGQPVLRSKAKEMEKQFAARMQAAFADRPRRRHDPVRAGRAGFARGGDRAARSRRSDGASDRRRHRADADDEGRRVPAEHGSSACAPSRSAVPRSSTPTTARLRIGAHDAARRCSNARPRCAQHAPVITRTLRTLSNVRVRNVATVGGNLAHADPHMDLPPVLIALGAQRRGRRPRRRAHDSGRGSVRRLFRDRARARRTDHRASIVPAQGARRAAYLKCTTRAVHDWPALGVAVSLDSEATAVRDAAIVISAATEKPTRLPGVGSGVARRRARRRAVPRRPATRPPTRPRLITDGQGSAAYKKQLVRVYVGARACARRCEQTTERGTDGDQDDRQRTGRALGAAPRRRRPRSPAAPNTSTICACPACCTERSSAAPSRTGASRASTSSAARALAGVHRVVTIDDVRKVIPNPFYGPAFHDQPILAADKVHYVGEPVAVVLAADPHIADAAAQLIVADYEELPAVFDEVEAMTSAAIVHDVLKPAGTFPDLKHLQGKQEHQRRARFPPAARRRGEAASPQADHVFEHTFRTQQVLHLPLEPFVSVGEADRRPA